MTSNCRCVRQLYQHHCIRIDEPMWHMKYEWWCNLCRITRLKKGMDALNYYVTCSHIQVLIGQQVYLTCMFFDMQRPKRHSIVWEILVENETTEQMDNETQKVSERNRFWLCFTGNGDIRICKQNNFLVRVVCVCVNQLRTNSYLQWRPIVHHPLGLPITAGCDTDWIRTRDRSGASCTEMQCLRPLRPCLLSILVQLNS
jgi:hypothetical protein